MKITSNRPLTDITNELARSIRERMNVLIAQYAPSRSNGRTNAWIAAVKNMFSTLNVNEEAYWEYVRSYRPPTEKKVSTGNTTIPGFNETSI